MKRNITINTAKNIRVINKKLKSLDELFGEYKIIHCDFLKIDCEGCEYQILKNTSIKTLKKINYIAMECHLFNKKMIDDYQQLKSRLNKTYIIKELNNPVHAYLKFLFLTASCR